MHAYEAYGDFTYRVNLFERTPFVTAEQLASEINEALIPAMGDDIVVANDDFVMNGEYGKISPDKIHLLNLDWAFSGKAKEDNWDNCLIENWGDEDLCTGSVCS